MSNLEKFMQYAAAFEHARDSDDWSVTFDGDVIVELADQFDANARAIIAAHLREYGAALGIGLSAGEKR